MKNCKLCSTPTKLLYDDMYDDRYGYDRNFAVYQCPECAFAMLEPELTEEEIAPLYTDYYPRKNITAEQTKASAQYSSALFSRLKKWCLGINRQAQYGVSPNAKVLDIGCGNGASLLDIKTQGAEAYGTEFDLNVKPVAEELGLDIHFEDIHTLTYPDEFFDVITMNQLIEHVIDPIDFLNTIKKKLKSGGKIIITTPNIDGTNATTSNTKWINLHIPYHLNYFSKNSWDHLTNKTELDIESVSTFTPAGWMELQYLTNHTPRTPQGTPGPIWLPGANGISRLSYLTSRILSYLTIPIWRIRDRLLKGDSWHIVLKKPEL